MLKHSPTLFFCGHSADLSKFCWARANKATLWMFNVPNEASNDNLGKTWLSSMWWSKILLLQHRKSACHSGPGDRSNTPWQNPHSLLPYVGRLGSEPRLVGRIGSGVRDSASLEKNISASSVLWQQKVGLQCGGLRSYTSGPVRDVLRLLAPQIMEHS